MVKKRNVQIQNPEVFGNLRLKDPSDSAAGLPGVTEALRHTFKEMGLLRSMGTLLKMNQKEGFDCPGCAWPDPEQPSKIGEFCENGAKALADEATRSSIGADFFAQHSVEALSRYSDYELNQLGRLTEPLVLRPGKMHYEPIFWEDAYRLIADRLKALDHPDEAVFYTSGRSSNEAAFLYGQFIRAFGTNNMPDCSNMCHESSGVALSETLGIGKGSATLEDLHGAELVIVAGQNPGTNHPRMLSALQKCKANGGKIISINPIREAGLVRFKNPQQLRGWVGKGTPLADLHLPVKINEDITLLKLLLKKLKALEVNHGGVFDSNFIQAKTQGYQALMADLDAHDAAALQSQCGVPGERIDKAVGLLAKRFHIVVCWAMGLTQHENAVATIREYVNLLLLKGAVGKPNAGTFPVRGHSNVQGDRSVGIMHKVDFRFNERIRAHMGFEPPEREGYDTVEAIQAMHQGKAKVFMALGGNFLMAASDTSYTARALQNCSLTVQVSTKLNRSHLVTGDTALILPTYGRSEKDSEDADRYVTVESSTGKVKRSKGILKPVSGNLQSEPEIIGGMAATYFTEGHPVDWKRLGTDYGRIRKKMDLVAKGFRDTESQSKGAGYYLPNNARVGDFSELLGGKAQITVNPLPQHKLATDELLLMTLRSHDQFNTTVYGLHDRYRGVFNERRVLFMSRKDMRARGLKSESVVHLTSTYNGVVRRAQYFKVIPYDIPQGNAAAYFPETNGLVPIDQIAKGSGTPISKSVRIRVEKAV